jgi:alpha-amylase
MKNKISVFLLICLLITPFSFIQSQAPSQSTDVILEAFSWNSYTSSQWTNIQNQSDEIGNYFSIVWLPPSGKHGGVDYNQQEMGYLPIYYFNQHSSFGTQAQLISLISTLKGKGVKAMADIVINHRVGVSNWVDFPTEIYNGTTYTWGLNTICGDDKVCDCANGCSGYTQTPTGNNDTGSCYAAARDIDHTNTNVQATIEAYLQFLKDTIGYSAWRYDFVKGYGAGYIKMYNNSANNYLSVGEYFDYDYNNVANWIAQTDSSSMAFDFPLKQQLNYVFNNGDSYAYLSQLNGTTPQPCGLIKNQNRRYAVTFVDNHDTGRTDGSDGANPLTKNVLAAYAYILSQPGVPCVFWDHWNNDTCKSSIETMINARKEVGINSESNVVVNQTNSTSYVATITGFQGSLILKLGPGSYTSIGSDYSLVISGTNYEIWKKVTGLTNTQKVKTGNNTFVYANPVKDILKIETAENIDKIEISTTQGKTIKLINNISSSASQNIDVSNLKTGVYLVNVFYKNNTHLTGKFIKE